MRRPLWLMALLLLPTLTASAQLDNEEDAPKVSVLSAVIEPATARAGEVVTLKARFAVDPEWHIYGALDTAGGQPTILALKQGAALTAVGKYTLPPGEKHEQWGETYYWLQGEFEVTQQLRVPKDAKPGDVKLAATLTYLPCDKDTCLMKQVIPVAARLTVEAGKADPAKTQAREVDPPGTADTGKTDAKDKGKTDPEEGPVPTDLWTLVTLAFFAGLLALVMPCTYPMIPITISFFTKQADVRGGKVLPLSLAYGVGIISMFILIGVVVGPVIVVFATHPATNIAIGLLFLIFALSLFGVYNLNPPAWMMNFAGQASSRGGFGGVFMMGATLVITSFTCTAPFVGSLLSFGAQGGDQAKLLPIVVGMGVFGLTMAVPFVFLSLAPGKLSSMPKSGEWMHVIKVSLGFLEVAAALKFFSNADLVLDWGFLSRELFLMLWAGIFAATAAYLFGWIKMSGHAEDGVGPLRMSIALLVLMFATYCWYGAQGHKLDPIMLAIAPNYSGLPRTSAGAGKAVSQSHPIFKDDWDGALARAKKENKKLLVNFTGFT